MQSIDTTTKPKRQYTRKTKGGISVPSVEAKPIEIIKPVEVVEVKPVEVKPVEVKAVEVKAVESKPTFVDVIKTNTETKTKKKKRNINPDAMTYLKAFQIWKQKTGYSGLSPKRNTDEYNQVMAILNEHKNK